MSEFGFMLKKFVSFFVEPYGMVLSLFIFGFFFLYFKKDRLAKLFFSFAFGLFMLYTYPPFSNYLVKNLEDRYKKYDYTHDIKYIHVLGSGHNGDKSQPISSRVFATRVIEGVKYITR